MMKTELIKAKRLRDYLGIGIMIAFSVILSAVFVKLMPRLNPHIELTVRIFAFTLPVVRPSVGRSLA